MGKLKKLQNKIARAELGSVMEGKDSSDDQAAAAQQRGMTSMVGNAVGAQQQVINAQAQAATGGNPQMVGAQRQAVGNLGQAVGESAVRQTSEANRLRGAMREKRKANSLNLAAGVRAQNQADAALAVEGALGAVEVATHQNRD